MYKEIEQIKSGSSIKYTNYGIFMIKEHNNRKEIVQINSNDNKPQKYNFINMDEVYRLAFTEDNLITSLKNDTTIFYSINTNNIFQFDNQLSLAQVMEDQLYIYIVKSIFIAAKLHRLLY